MTATNVTGPAFEVVAEGTASVGSTGAVSVEIVDVVDGSIKVYADTIREGDALFDATGGTHKVARTRQLKAHSKVTRADGWVDYFGHDDIVTILPDGNAGRAIDFESSGSSQHYIETGRRNTVDETEEYRS